MPSGDLSRCVVHEADDSWPVTLEIVAYFGEQRKRRRSIEISADQFWGRNGYGAPMTGEQLFSMIERLRKSG